MLERAVTIACALQAGPSSPCDRCSVDGLIFVRGAALNCSHSDFGGLSSLAALGPDTLLAVTDRNHWMHLPAEPRTGLQLGNIGPLCAPAAGDAEAVTISQANTVYVSFENAQADALLAYNGLGTACPVEHIRIPEVGASAVSDCGLGNAMYETLELVDDTHLLCICESNGRGMLFDLDSRAPTRRFTYPLADGLQPTDAVRLRRGIGGVLILERKYLGRGYPLGQAMHIRVCHWTNAQISGADNDSAPRVLLELLPNVHRADNFEGIAALESEAGARIFLVSDDNFSSRQQTLLWELWLSYDPPPPSTPPRPLMPPPTAAVPPPDPGTESPSLSPLFPPPAAPHPAPAPPPRGIASEELAASLVTAGAAAAALAVCWWRRRRSARAAGTLPPWESLDVALDAKSTRVQLAAPVAAGTVAARGTGVGCELNDAAKAAAAASTMPRL